METLRPFNVRLDGAEERKHLFGRDPKTAGLRSGQVMLDPGESVGEHNTDKKEEIIIVFEGKAEITSDRGPSMVIDKESVSYIPPNTMHNVKNIGKETLRYIYVVSPAENNNVDK